MKKILFVAAVAAMFAASCDNRTVEQKIEDFKSETKSLTDQANAEIEAVMSDSLLTEREAAEKIQQLVDVWEPKINEVAYKALKKNKDNILAVEALKSVYYELETDELEKIINSLSEEVRQDPFIQNAQASLEAKKATAEGQRFTDFEVVQDELDSLGSKVKFSDFVGNGKYVLVDFWASWCGPCKREIPNIASVYEKFKGDDFDVLSIAVWDKPEASKETAAYMGIVWNQIINAQRIPTDIYGIEGIPHIMLIGPDGTILKRNLRGDNIEQAVSEALGR